MEYLHNGFTLELCEGSFPLSTDSIALAGFARLPKGARVLDLGAGCGTLGLLLCASHDDCTVTGIELDLNAHTTALHNARNNRIDHRYSSICGDMRQTETLFPPGSFHVCISNPPYFTDGPASQTVPAARQELHCTMDDLFRCAAWSLRYGGDFFLVHRPERFAQLCACASAHKLEPKRVCMLRHKPGSPASVLLIQCRKGAKVGLLWEEQQLYNADGSVSDYYKSLYHL